MRIMQTLLAVVGFSVAMSVAHAGEIFVVANAKLEVSDSDVRDVFLGEKQTAVGVKIAPIDNLSCQAAFLEKVLRLNLVKYNSVWQKKGFRDGLNPPMIAATDTDVLAAVRLNPSAIGYVSDIPPSAMGRGIKIVQKITF
jgi:hypothetical protein